jgi:hypothetical protein
MRAHNETLREQLEAERRAHAEARRIIAGLMERIPAVEAAPEERESPETPSEPVPGSRTPPEPEMASPRRPWWSRIFR